MNMASHRWALGRWPVVVGVALCLCAAVAPGQVDGPADVDLNDALAALDSDTYAAREGATEALVQSGAVTDEQIASLIERRDLSPEQTSRLMRILRERFVSTGRGAIGIQYSRAADPPRIAMVYPEFPAGKAKLLKVGDEIVSIEGRPLAGHIDTMREETFSRDPGDILHLHIRREVRPEGEENEGAQKIDLNRTLDQAAKQGATIRELDIEVQLGSTESFPQMVDKDRSVMERSFQVRLSRMGVTTLTERTIEPNVRAEAWNQGVMHVPGPADRMNRVLAGPVGVGDQGGSNYAGLTVAQQNARLIRQLDALRQGGDRANLPNGLNARVEIGNVAGGGRVQIQRVELPQELQKQNAERIRRVQAQIVAAQQKRMALQAEMDGLSRPATPGASNPVGEANRLATQIGTLEGQIAEQTRVLRSSASDDPNVRRLVEERIGDLRTQVAALRVRLEDAMRGRTAGSESEASLDGE